MWSIRNVYEQRTCCLCLFVKYSGQSAPVIGEVRKSVIQTLTVTYVDVTPLSLPLWPGQSPGRTLITWGDFRNVSFSIPQLIWYLLLSSGGYKVAHTAELADTNGSPSQSQYTNSQQTFPFPDKIQFLNIYPNQAGPAGPWISVCDRYKSRH